MTLYEIKNEPLTIEELDGNFKELKAQIDSGLTPVTDGLVSKAELSELETNLNYSMLNLQNSNSVELVELKNEITNIKTIISEIQSELLNLKTQISDIQSILNSEIDSNFVDG